MSSDRGSRSFVGARNVLALVVLAGLLVLASLAGAFALGAVGTPSVVSTESRFAGVDASTTTIRTNVVVDNPNPVGIDRENATLTNVVRMNGIVMARGTERGLALPPGTSTREITTYMDNEKIPQWWVSHVRNGERTTVAIDTRVRSPLLGESFAVPRRRTIETDLLSAFNSTETRPVNADVPFRSGPVLFVNRTNATWGPVGETATPINARFGVYNPLSVPVPITELGYTVSMNGVRVGNGTTQNARLLDSERVTIVDTNLTIDATRLDEWWRTHLERNQRTTVRIDFSLRVDLPVVGTVRLPVDGLTYTTEFETDLLGTKEENTSAGSSASQYVGPTARTAVTTAVEG